MPAAEGNNYNPEGNPNIAVYGKNTRFENGGKNDPKAARAAGPANRYSIRDAIKKIGGAQVAGALSDPDKTRGGAEFIKLVAKELDVHPNDLSLCQLSAIKKFQLALAGNIKALDQLENSIDGKLVERKVEAQVTLADLVNKSFDQEFLNGTGDQGSGH